MLARAEMHLKLAACFKRSRLFRVLSLYSLHFHSLSLQKELNIQEEKKERADKMVRKIVRDVRGSGKKGKKDFMEGEEDIKVRELRDFNNSLMKKIGIIARDYPDMAPVLDMYCQQVGLPAPPSPGPGSSRASSSMSSSRSSTMSAR